MTGTRSSTSPTIISNGQVVDTSSAQNPKFGARQVTERLFRGEDPVEPVGNLQVHGG